MDAVGGWSTEGVGQSYGRGYGLEVKMRWMKAIVSRPIGVSMSSEPM